MAQTVKRLSAMLETWLQSLSREDPLEKEMATHSSTLAWKIPWTEEPGRLQSMGSQRVGHDWVTLLTHLFSEQLMVSNCQQYCSAIGCHPTGPSPFPFLCIKGHWIWIEGVISFETFVCHLLGLLAFWWKSSFLAPTTCLSIYWLVMRQTEQAWAW